MKYKKFIIFAFPRFYAKGGAWDIESSANTIETAELYLANMHTGSWDSAQIVDRDTWETVKEIERVKESKHD